MVTVTITEPKPECRPVQELERASGLSIVQLGGAIRPLVDLQRSVKGDDVWLQPSTTVGTLRVGDLRINVRPRLGNTDMATLIRYAYGSEFEPTARSQIDTDHDGLDELLCCVLADELSMIRQRGISRLYVNRKEPLTALRGRPDFLANFPWNEQGMTTLTCRYHELSCDNLDNRIIVAALDQAVLLDVRQSTRARLNAHRHAWHELARSRAISLADVVKARSVYTRLTEHYRLAHHLCETILAHLRPRSLFQKNDLVTAGVALDMAELFELTVYRLLRETLEPAGYAVHYQSSDSYAVRDGEGGKYRSVRPDILVFADGVPLAVIDAKYKDYWEADSETLIPTRKLSNDDIYQLFFYASRLQAARPLKSPPPAVIVSPVPFEDELEGRQIISNRFRYIHLHAGGVGNTLLLAFLPLTAVLPEIAASRGNMLQCPSIQSLMSTISLGSINALAGRAAVRTT